MPSSCRSAPPQNASPAPVKTTARVLVVPAHFVERVPQRQHHVESHCVASLGPIKRNLGYLVARLADLDEIHELRTLVAQHPSQDLARSTLRDFVDELNDPQLLIAGNLVFHIVLDIVLAELDIRL